MKATYGLLYLLPKAVVAVAFLMAEAINKSSLIRTGYELYIDQPVKQQAFRVQ